MKKYGYILFFLLYAWKGDSQENQIRILIDQMFHAMIQKDTSTLRACFTPTAQLMTYSYDAQGNSRNESETVSDFIRQIGLMGETVFEERLTGWQCLVDDGIASVWTPYEFYFNQKFSHCGVNSFQLMKVGGAWKITQLTDTRRKKDCNNDSSSIAVIDSLINIWHHAAAVADEKTFFGMMTADGIYIGTDASERWLRDELAAWSATYFGRESAWDFKPLSRNIKLAPGGQMAWFDELLDTWMGTCRSTGIVRKFEGDWKIIYYHLSIAVPNDKLDGYRSLIGKL